MKQTFKILSLICLGCFLAGCGNVNNSSSQSSTSIQPYTSNTSSEEPRVYDEEPDSTEGIDVTDLSDLYIAFNSITTYRSDIKSYFNEVGLYDYYRHYKSNYIQESATLFDDEKCYSYSLNPQYFDSLNQGYINIGENYYSYFKRGSTIEERLENEIMVSDLTLAKEDARYQDDLFTLYNLTSGYLSSLPFARVSRNKYALTDKEYLYQFIDICCPNLINKGYYMTFSKVTIELHLEKMDYRIRLYASKTQAGKLDEDSLDQENKPNWYLLFSESCITH